MPVADDATSADGDVLDAEVVDAEVVDAEIVDAEVVDDLFNGEPTGETPAVDLAAAAAAAGPIPESWFVNGESDDDADQEPGAETVDGEGTGGAAAGDISVEDLVIDLERVTTERDQYLETSRRLQAEFENYKKQVGKREVEARERANDSLVGELLPVLDAFDGAVANGAEDVAPMRTSFLDAMAKQGLERIDPDDGAFDPNLHEAVMHEDADDVDGPVVAEVMRAGYVWKGRVLRPAMVRTRG
jgi:molecular chaperone GrpE